MADKKVLILGARGFLGRHVARLYAGEGFEVTGLGHGVFSEAEKRRWGVSSWHEDDITLESLKKYGGRPDFILHAAGSGSVGFSLTDPLNDFRRTVESTAHVLEFVRLFSPGAKVVYPSSAGVYGAAEKLPTPEDCPLRPVSPYGVHKMLAEDLCRSYARSFGVSSAIVRLFSVYGAGLRKQLLWDTCKKISREELEFFGTGAETRDWLHVEDASRLIFIAGGKASPDCPAVNGGSGAGVTVREVLSEVFLQFNRKDAPVFTGAARPGDPTDYAADIEKASGWGWKPRIGWREGVAEYVEWFRKEEA